MSTVCGTYNCATLFCYCFVGVWVFGDLFANFGVPQGLVVLGMSIILKSDNFWRFHSNSCKKSVILLKPNHIQTCNFEAICGCYSLKTLIFVHSHSNIILQLHFDPPASKHGMG